MHFIEYDVHTIKAIQSTGNVHRPYIYTEILSIKAFFSYILLMHWQSYMVNSPYINS